MDTAIRPSGLQEHHAFVTSHPPVFLRMAWRLMFAALTALTFVPLVPLVPLVPPVPLVPLVPLGGNRYYRGEGYFETDMDTGSSAAAASLCGRCRGLSRKIDVELGIVLQASDVILAVRYIQHCRCPG